MMQPGVVTGAVYEFHAEKALLGGSPGTNTPLTTAAHDTSGNGNHGTLTSFAGTTASGWAGSGTLADPHRLVFDGANDVVTVAALDMTGAPGYALELWIEKNAAGDWWGNVLQHAGGTASGPRIYWTLDYSFSIVIAAVDGSAIVQWQPDFMLTTGVLTHFALSVDNTALTATVFVNGVAAAPVALDEAMGMPRAAISSGLVIGGANVPVSLPLARIYPYALSAEQVAANYAAGYLWTAPVPVDIPSPVVVQRPPITIEAAGLLARAKRRKDYCHVFVDFDTGQWYAAERDDMSPGIQLDRAGRLKFACAQGSVMANASYTELWYHLNNGLSVEQDIYGISFDWRSLGTMTWTVYETDLPIDGCSWASLGTGGGATNSSPDSVSYDCSAGMRGLAIRVAYVSGKTLSEDEWVEFAELRVRGQAGDISIGDALTGILVTTGLGGSYSSGSVA